LEQGHGSIGGIVMFQQAVRIVRAACAAAAVAVAALAIADVRV